MDIYDRSVNLVDLRRRVGMVFQKSNPFPKSVFENVVFGPRVAGMNNRARLNEIVERCLRGRRPVGRGQGPAERLGAEPVRRPGAAAVHRPRPGHRPGSAAAGRAGLGPRPASTARIEDLIFELKRDYTIVIVTHNMQQAARVSDLTAFFFQGRLIEAGPTDQLYTRPQVKQTEDYITGRFG